jgi:DNA-binding response OmpR family regulator
MRVLLIEDEPHMAQLVSEQVGRAGYMIDHVGSIGDADAAIAVARFALILLDRRLPDGDGLVLLRRMRARQPGVPVIILTALDDVADKVGGLDAGADDYLTKPFARDELLARIRTALRRPAGEAEPPIGCARLQFDPASREVSVAGAVSVFKRRELALIESLIRRVGRVVARETLMDEVYTFDDDIQSNTLDAHVSRLRRRLADLDAGVIIHPVRGVGYMMDAA